MLMRGMRLYRVNSVCGTNAARVIETFFCKTTLYINMYSLFNKNQAA